MEIRHAYREYQRPSMVSLCVYYIRIIALSFLYMLAVQLFTNTGSTMHKIFVWSWIGVVLFVWLLWLPVFYYKHRYKLDDELLYVVGGVIYTRVDHISRSRIQVVSLARTPLQMLFGLATLRVSVPGKRVLLHNIPYNQAIILSTLLAPKGDLRGAEDEDAPLEPDSPAEDDEDGPAPSRTGEKASEGQGTKQKLADDSLVRDKTDQGRGETKDE